MKNSFKVPVDSIVEFAEILEGNELANEIIGTTDDNKIIVEVEYGKEEFDTVQELSDLLEGVEDDE